MREPPDKDHQPPQKNQAAAELGRRGGLKGGATRAARMTPEERSASARQAAAARWARIAAEQKLEPLDEEIERASQFEFTLTPEEAVILHEAHGSGGQQTLHRRLVAQLAHGNLTIRLDDRRFGELIRYMTKYGQGGFQDRLKRAFGRELSKLFAFLTERTERGQHDE